MLRAKDSKMQLPEDDSGQGLIEYTLIAALIALIALASVSRLGATIEQMFATWTLWASSLH